MLQINLLTLLMHRWLKQIKFIQAAYRKYRIVKLARLQVLYVICLKSSAQNSAIWTKAPNNLKYQILSAFLIKTCYKYSRLRSKYLYDTRMVNKGFTRNFSYWAGDVISNAMGRNFTISLPPPPTFTLMSRGDELIDFITKYNNTKQHKKRGGRNSINIYDKSYY